MGGGSMLRDKKGRGEYFELKRHRQLGSQYCGKKVWNFNCIMLQTGISFS